VIIDETIVVSGISAAVMRLRDAFVAQQRREDEKTVEWACFRPKQQQKDDGESSGWNAQTKKPFSVFSCSRLARWPVGAVQSVRHQIPQEIFMHTVLATPFNTW
jgi:hypothetical protein